MSLGTPKLHRESVQMTNRMTNHSSSHTRMLRFPPVCLLVGLNGAKKHPGLTPPKATTPSHSQADCHLYPPGRNLAVIMLHLCNACSSLVPFGVDQVSER
ncbi:hypothetical protein LY78DRAFT_364154 [Colletotrichum sublineola]|nr:hypothetical protein LY78DRAFT_364154 [Colletotrichum sublineola]